MGEERSIAAPQEASDGFSDALSGILSNPEIMATIASMAGKLKGSGAPQKSEEQNQNQDAGAAPQSEGSRPSLPLPEAVSALAPLLTGEGIKHSQRDSDRACLLRALKPYLSPGRSEAIDYIIKFSSIAELLKNLS